jgi:hypothetical protein
MNYDLELDADLTPEQEALVAKLSPEAIEEIDQQIISECIEHWRKVARVVGSTIMRFQEQYPELTDGFYSLRVQSLVNDGKLESRGNLKRMRYSEVRLPGGLSET